MRALAAVRYRRRKSKADRLRWHETIQKMHEKQPPFTALQKRLIVLAIRRATP